MIGGGFCGAFFAAQLAHHSAVPLSISVIEPREQLGGGVAYSSVDPAHRINVPASRMTLFPDTPDHFDRWFREAGGLAEDNEALWSDGHIYPRRAVFGRYIAELVAARQKSRIHAPITHVRGRAIAANRHEQGYKVQLEAGGTVEADVLVLATSHPPPEVPALLADALGDNPRMIANPWAPEALESIQADAPVAIIGTGLTMADVVASLDRRGHEGPITAFSRRGQLSRGHALAPMAPFTWFDATDLPHSTLALLREARRQIASAAAQGNPWQGVFDNIRANGQRLWQGLDMAERRRFLRHLRVYWDAHRYRVAPQVEAVVRRKRQEGTLTVQAAALRAVKATGGKITLTLQPRHKPGLMQIAARHVVVTTGPDHGTALARNPVLASLAAQGLIRADHLALGLAVDARAQAVQAGGSSSPTLLVVGPLARSHYGELMGLPQVAAQPDQIAAQLAAWAAAAQQLSA